MGEKLIIGPYTKGLSTYLEPFNISNDSFPQLVNAYQWRGRVKRKRGTSLLGRLQRYLGTTNGAGNLTVTIKPVPIASGIVSFTIGTDIFTDQGGASPVTMITNSTGTGVLDRNTGVLTITGSQPNTAVIYYPSLPVMGLEDLVLDPKLNPGTLAFDTDYSYNINQTAPYNIYDVTFYKNPSADPTNLPGYVPKAASTPFNWNGQDYQQFWTTNYQGALWATNGVTVPFNTTNIGMQFKAITNVVIVAAGPPAIARLTINGHGLVVGDYVFINEVVGITGINWQTGYVITVNDANTITVEFPFATLGGAYISGGIAQYLTNTADPTRDCLRWYDGDPTNGTQTTATGPKGWVNFSPPLSQSAFSIADLPAAIYYLVGAKLVQQFKDRLIFFGPVVQTSSSSPSPIYLPDVIVYSQNGTPYYTTSYTNTPNAAVDTPTSATNVFHSILLPDNQTATSPAYFSDSTGFGGFLATGLDQPIKTIGTNKDVFIVGFENIQTRLVYSGNDIIPFNFYLINSEFGSSSSFSSIVMDQIVISRGNRGYVATSQNSAERIDVEIPDDVFEVRTIQNGIERFTAQRDFISEWIYFTYPSNSNGPGTGWKFPNQTLFWNYRDNSWAIFNESYTTYGQFRRQDGYTWANIGTIYPTWSSWNVPWNAGLSTVLQPKVIGGNQQGFVLEKDDGTDEGNSLYIQNFNSSVVTSPNHTLNEGDYITISGVLGTIGAQVNGKVFSVGPDPTDTTFTLNPAITAGTYLGGGYIKRFYVPFIQSKQFPTAWNFGRKTRIGVQQYLLTKTTSGQVTLLIYLSQDAETAWNNSPVIPALNVTNSSLVYSTLLYTCPESTNLGLTPANVNLQMPTASTQQQIWHRINTSLIGDTIQFAITLNDTQMRDPNLSLQIDEIEYHGTIIDVTPSQLLA